MDNHANNPAGGMRATSEPPLQRHIIRMGNICFGVREGNSLTLTGTDRNGSLLWSRNTNSTTGTVHRWSPYGSAQPADASMPGFNGERIDPASGVYHLGNGYRTYNPALMRFNSPDSLSPFGAGGINPYAYCAGDPVNYTDPSGHLSWQAIAGITLGTIGLAASIVTGGLSVVAAGGIAAALGSASATALAVGGLGVVADATAIASGAVEESDPEASSVLGWISLATGLPGAVAGLAGMAKSIKGAIKKPATSVTPVPVTSEFILAEQITTLRSSSKTPRKYPSLPIDEHVFSKPFHMETDTIFSGYMSNFHETGEPVLLVHGNENIFIIKNINHNVGNNIDTHFYDMNTFVHHLNEQYDINLLVHNGERLHLVACMSVGETGTAQRLANVLKRPIVAYGNKNSKIRSCDFFALKSFRPHITIGNQIIREINEKSYTAERIKTTIYYPRSIDI